MSSELGELSDFDINHPGDAGSEMFEREKEMALDMNVSDLIAQINAALGKIDEGTFGCCENCGSRIAKARLEALPYATLCIGCQTRLEGL